MQKKGYKKYCYLTYDDKGHSSKQKKKKRTIENVMRECECFYHRCFFIIFAIELQYEITFACDVISSLNRFTLC